MAQEALTPEFQNNELPSQEGFGERTASDGIYTRRFV